MQNITALKSKAFAISSFMLPFIFVLYTIVWVFINLFISHDARIFDYFTDSYGITALFGGIAGVIVASKWGGMKSVMGRAIYLFALGLLFKFLGQVSYAIVFYGLQIENPYPSFGDIFYFGSIIIYLFAICELGVACGIKSRINDPKKMLTALVLPIVMIVSAYYAYSQSSSETPETLGQMLSTMFNFSLLGSDASLLTQAWVSFITLVLDFGYPMGYAIFASFAVVVYWVSRDVLGGVLKSDVVLLIVAMLVQYIGDVIFLYYSMTDTWRAGGIDDYIFLTSYFLMGMALIKFGKIADRLKNAS